MLGFVIDEASLLAPFFSLFKHVQYNYSNSSRYTTYFSYLVERSGVRCRRSFIQ